jgi:hypothetical protein
MHFFYLDETGCTGPNLGDLDQPIFVIGGLSVTDERWRKTTEMVEAAIAEFFGARYLRILNCMRTSLYRVAANLLDERTINAMHLRTSYSTRWQS